MTESVPLIETVLVGSLSWMAAIFFTPLVRRFAIQMVCVARPSQDRWGRRVVARLGGLPIALVFLGILCWQVRFDPRTVGLLMGGILMLATGLADDLWKLHPYSKLVTQIVAGCLVVLWGIQIALPGRFLFLSAPLTIGWLVLVMNAFNLMDNMDGLSAGVGVIAAGFCAWHAFERKEYPIALVSAGLGGATLGFLRYNFPPAKIFMGDAGSQVLGLGLGALALMGTWHQSTRLLGILALPTFLLAVPIFDTLFVTIQRIFHGRHPFQGGTDHLSHRLGILGLTTRQVVVTLYGVSIAFGLLSIVLTSQSPLMITVMWLFVTGLLLLFGSYLGRVRVYTDIAATASAEQKVTFIETTLFHKWRILEVVVDFVLICASYIFAYALRFEGSITAELEALILQSLPWVISVKMICFFSCGLYRGMWRYTSLMDLINVLRAVALSSGFCALLLLALWRFEGYSRAVLIMDGVLLFVLVSGARVTERLLNEWIASLRPGSISVLIVGAGDTGELLLRQIKTEPRGTRRVVGFLDDDGMKQGSNMHGIPIIGTRRDLGRIAQACRVREVLIAMSDPPADLVQQIRGYCEENGIAWRVVNVLWEEKLPFPPER